MAVGGDDERGDKEEVMMDEDMGARGEWWVGSVGLIVGFVVEGRY